MSIPISQKVKIIRLLRGLQQADLARLTGLNRRTLVLLETDVRATNETIKKIEAAFGHEAGWLTSPSVEAAFAILANDFAGANAVTVALAILERANGRP